MKNTALLFILFLGFYLFSCSSSKPTTQIIKDGKYNFAFYDTAANKKCDGNLTLENAESNKIFGKYKVVNRSSDTIPGLNYTKGYYEGTVDTKTGSIFMNMNPKIADANLFVNSILKADSLIGTWNFSTMKGIQSRGIFKAALSE